MASEYKFINSDEAQELISKNKPGKEYFEQQETSLEHAFADVSSMCCNKGAVMKQEDWAMAYGSCSDAMVKDRELESRRGVFTITRELREELTIAELEGIFIALTFIPFDVDHKFDSGSFVHKGYSHKFDKLGEGGCAKEYHINFLNKDGLRKLTVTRVEDHKVICDFSVIPTEGY